MSAHAAPTAARLRPALSGRSIAHALSSPHVRGVALLVVLAGWLARRLLFTSALPAGTDMLGFVTRARENADWGHMLSLWTPSSFGAPRPYTLDAALGLLTRITGDPVVTIKILVVSTFLAGGLLAYLLSWRWYRSALAATLTGVLFVTSQSLLTRWASGALNVELAFAFAPLLLLLWGACLERFTFASALALGAACAAVVYVRLDMVLYAAPFLLVQLVVLAAAGHPRAVLLNAGRSAAVAVATLTALTLGEIVPLLGGARPAWASGAHVFRVQDLANHSLGAFQSLVGFGREIGYLAFTGKQTWQSHPWLPTWAYLTLSTLIPALAFAALYLRRDARTIFLAVAAIIATFLGKGFLPPLGEPYRWASDHVALFADLRNPNRWLVFQALAYAMLAGVTLSALHRRLRAARRQRVGRFAAPAVGALVAASLLGVAPQLASGFRTWRPLSDQMALLRAVAQDKADFRVATVPYDQTTRFVRQGRYRGFEHDLGGESALWTGHPAVVDGGWQPASADFVAFTSTLLRRRDAAFGRLLGTVAVKWLVSFAYPPTAPHLAVPGLEPRYQQLAVARMPGLRAQPGANPAGTVYGVPSSSPLISLRPRLALVLGGQAGLAGLADLPGMDLRRWVAITAPDAIRQGGIALLVRLMRSASLIVAANERTRDLALLSTPAAGRIPPISSDPGRDHLTELLPSDASIRSGSLDDPAVAPAPAQTMRASSVVDVAQGGRRVELWSRVEVGPTAGELTYRLDGRTVQRVTPLAMRRAFRWIRTFAGRLAGGPHRLSIQGSRSPYGSIVEVDESKLVDPAVLGAQTSRLRSATRAAAPKIVYTLDLADVQRWAKLVHRFPRSTLFGEHRPGFWRTIEPGSTVLAVVREGHRLYTRVDAQAGRRVYTVVEHDFARPQRWGHSGYLFLTYRGTGDGGAYRLIADFDRRHRHSVEFRLVDDQPGVQLRAFAIGPLRDDGPGVDWDHVSDIRFATEDLHRRSVLELGTLTVDRPISSANVAFPVVPSETPRQLRLVDPARPGAGRLVGGIDPGARKLRWQLTESQLDANLRLQTAVPRSVLRSPPLGRARYRRTGATSFDVRVDAPAGGWLVLGEGFDSGWRLHLAGREIRPVPAFSIVNAYRIPPGRHAGTLAYAGDRLGHRGLALSVLAAALVAAALATLALRRRRHPADALPATPAPRSPHPPARWWRLGLAATLAVVVATPVVSRLVPFVDADWLALVSLAALTVVAAAAAYEERG